MYTAKLVKVRRGRHNVHLYRDGEYVETYTYRYGSVAARVARYINKHDFDLEQAHLLLELTDARAVWGESVNMAGLRVAWTL